MSELLIQARNLGRRYGRRVALRGVHLDLGPGELVALVGPNGSGKTTFLKLIAGFLRPSEGQVEVCGMDPARQRAAVMQQARFAFAPPPLYDQLSAREHLRFLAMASCSLPRQVRQHQVDAALERVGLLDRAEDRVATFSFGMRQRLALALALVPAPRLIVLDEPGDGLDPLAVRELRTLLLELSRDQHLGVLISSHLLEEAAHFADRWLVLHEGQTVFHGTTAELRADGEEIRVRVTDPSLGKQALAAAGLQLREAEGYLCLPPGSLTLEDAARLFDGSEARLLEFHVQAPQVQDALLARLERGFAGDDPGSSAGITAP
jgi:ABC-2 type transport system ATP-binding protein